MITDWRAWIRKFALAIAVSSVTVSCRESIVLAQIIPDDTLGAESSVVTPDRIKGIESERISGGAVRGNNLFHSFSEFNIGEGRGGYFENPTAIENIFSRVTGSNPSEILGTLGVLGNANLFFLNPNGIIFGDNASLDLRGSFLATTADNILFPDGNKFSAVNPDVPSLLTVNVQQPIGLEFEGKEGIITNAADLAVASRQTLSLSGRDVATTGSLTAPGGKVEVLGTNSVALLEDANIDVSAPTGGGTVLIGGDFQGQGTIPNAKRTYVGDRVTINADTLNYGNGGKVIVWADEVTGFYGSISARGGAESGNGGLVEVSGKEHLIFRGNVNTSAVNGLPGTLLLDPTNIIIADGSGDEAGDGTDTFAGNNSGIEGSILSKPLSQINDTAPTTIYESELEGLSGDTNIILQATNDITLQDLIDNELELAAGAGVITLSADADEDGVGDFVMENAVADTIFTNGRDIEISGTNLTLSNIDTSIDTGITGNGGAVKLNATDEVNLNGIVDTSSNLGDGGDVSLSAQGNINLNPEASIVSSGLLGGNISLISDDNISVLGGEIRTDTLTTLSGTTGGAVNIKARAVFLTDGAVIASRTFAAGNAGAIEITASETISLVGKNSQGFGSGIFSGVLGAAGNSEGITIDTGSLLLTEGAVIFSSTSGEGNAGTVKITASETISLEGENSQGFGSGIGSQVALPGTAGNSGGIKIETGSLSLKNGAAVNASTRGEGDAGAITIKATDSITLSGEDSQGFSSSIGSQVGQEAKGTSRGINIDTRSLSLQNGAVVDASTLGEGDAGAITIKVADAILLEGENSKGALSGISSTVFSGAKGTAGEITIETDSLFLQNGAIVSARTSGVGDAGAITITAADVITLEGESSQGVGSFIFSGVDQEAEGTAGGITIETGSLSLKDGTAVSANTSGVGDAGAITIKATDSITLSGENSQGFVSGILSQVNPRAEGTAGGITIETGSLFLQNGARISASTFGMGDAGAITIKSIDSITLSGEDSQDFGSGIFSTVQSESEGDSKGISITTAFLSLTDGATISASTEGEGKAGEITLNTPRLIISKGSSIESFTQGEGRAGNITVSATDSIILNSDTKLSVESSDVGRAGNIIVITPLLIIGENAQLSATATETSTSKKAGDITLDVSQLNISGELGIFAETQSIADAGSLEIQPYQTNPNLNVQFTEEGFISARTTNIGDGGSIAITAHETIDIRGNGSITVETFGRGQAGDITITTQNFNLSNLTEISASTFSNGQAGNINITANNFNLAEGATVITNTANRGQGGDIRLNIKDNLNLVNSTISASTTKNSTGTGGSIFIDPQKVTLNNSQIAVNSQGSGTGGNIYLQADALTLVKQSAITAETLSTDGGNIEITLGGNLLLRDKSQISTTAGTAEAGGNGGKITIDAPFIIALPQENSDIIANAFEGDGGNIIINANGLFGIEFRDETTPLSDITASSEFGQEGEVEINTSGIDPTRGLNNLPQDTVETEVAQGCQTVGGQPTLEFFAIGRGGLPPTPEDLFSSDVIIAEWIPLDLETEIKLQTGFTEDKVTNLILLNSFSCRK